MSSFALKLIAYILMIIDHCTVAFKWSNELRCISRISFPIFAYLISEGCKYTKDFKIYILRLLICAFTSHIICVVMGGEVFLQNGMNVLFTFSSACIGIYIFQMLKKNQNTVFIKYWIIFAVMIFAEFFRFDYGFIGVGLVFLFYICKNKKCCIISIILFIVIKYWYFIFIILYGFLNGIILDIIENQKVIHNICSALFTFLSSLFIYFYNGKRGFYLKYLFYFLYPSHIFIILAFTKI